jgi:NAD(P)-dependent dehydrogenase (short-subunit alcohol dehydrogenase family)
MVETTSNVQTALVTGAGRGLGAATVTTFVSAGYCVAALDVGPGIDEFTTPDGSVMGCRCDVSDARAVAETVANVLDRFGRIDVAVNCAGIDHTYWLAELSVEQFDQVIGVNLRGPFLISKAVWPVMQRQGGGHIVNVASTAAIRVWSGASAYHASKFGLLGFSRSLSAEGRRDGIRVTTVIPGGMQTGFFDRFTEQGIPLPDPETLQDPAVVALAILYAVQMPAGSVIQELVVTPPNEPSWP